MALITFCLVFALYLFTLCPVIYTGDSALFSTTAFGLGTAHPPGYPLYNILGKALTFLPLGSIAYKTNLLSLLAGALSASFVSLITFRITENRLISIAGGLVASLQPLLWWESVKAEVYSLNAALSLFILYQGVMMIKGSALYRRAFLSAFILGLGFGNHHTIGFIGLALIVPLTVNARTLKWNFLFLPLFFVLGFSVNLYTYIRSVSHIENGSLFNYSTVLSLNDFINVFLRKVYSGGTPETFKSAASASSWYYGPKNFLNYIALENLGYLLALSSCIGVFYLFRKDKKLGIFIVFALLSSGALLAGLALGGKEQPQEAIYIVQSYFIPAIYILSMLSIVSFGFLDSFGERFKVFKKPLLVIALSIPFLIFPGNFKKAALHDSYTAYDHARDLYNTLPVKSLFFIGSDSTAFGSFYLNMVERLREDVLSFGPKGKKHSASDLAVKWKYKEFYPEFLMDRPVDSKFVVKKYSPSYRLHAYRPEPFKEFGLKSLPYGLSSVLLTERDIRSKSKKVKERFLKNAEKLNYERALDSTYRDYFTEELSENYFINVAHSAFIKKEFGTWGKIIELFPEGVGINLWYLKHYGDEEEKKTFTSYVFSHHGH